MLIGVEVVHRGDDWSIMSLYHAMNLIMYVWRNSSVKAMMDIDKNVHEVFGEMKLQLKEQV